MRKQTANKLFTSLRWLASWESFPLSSSSWFAIVTNLCHREYKIMQMKMKVKQLLLLLLLLALNVVLKLLLLHYSALSALVEDRLDFSNPFSSLKRGSSLILCCCFVLMCCSFRSLTSQHE